MPVIAKQNSIEQFYEYRLQQAAAAAADYAIYETVSSIHQRLFLFRNHHSKCAARRRNALANEMRQESGRADWLRRKYLDSPRQQQQQGVLAPSRLTPVSSSTPIAGSETVPTAVPRHESQDLNDMDSTDQSEFVDVKIPPSHMTDSGGMDTSTMTLKTTAGMTGTLGGSANVTTTTTTTVLVKQEPDVVDSSKLHQCGGDSPNVPESIDNSNSIKQDSEYLIKRRPSFTSKWTLLSSEQDTRDDLRLTAYDVIAGVISTPPIKPLEPDGDHCTNAVGPGVPSSTICAPSGPVSVPATFPKSIKEQNSLVQELDEFSKVMDQVTQEQIAIERRSSLSREMRCDDTSGSQHSPALLSSSYLPISNACPLEGAPLNKKPFYLHSSHSPSQVQEKSYHHHTSHQCSNKSSLLQPDKEVSDLTSSSNCVLPQTPTTPLEHFSFPSPPPSHVLPPTHLPIHQGTPHLPPHPGTPHLSPHPGTPHLPPQPYPLPHPGTPHPGTPHHSSSPLCSYSKPQSFPYDSAAADSKHLSSSSCAVGWSLATQQQQLTGSHGQPPSVTTSQGALKDSLLPRGNSFTVGHKRPPPMLDLSSMHPAKMKGGSSNCVLEHSGNVMPPPMYSPVHGPPPFNLPHLPFPSQQPPL